MERAARVGLQCRKGEYEMKLEDAIITDTRLQEMITGMKPYAKARYGIKINEFSSKDIYSAMCELQEARKLISRQQAVCVAAKHRQNILYAGYSDLAVAIQEMGQVDDKLRDALTRLEVGNETR